MTRKVTVSLSLLQYEIVKFELTICLIHLPFSMPHSMLIIVYCAVIRNFRLNKMEFQLEKYFSACFIQKIVYTESFAKHLGRQESVSNSSLKQIWMDLAVSLPLTINDFWNSRICLQYFLALTINFGCACLHCNWFLSSYADRPALSV